MPYLDCIDEGAKAIGAVNTVVNRQGKLYGYNTDFMGMKLMIEKNGFDFKDKKVLILGSGGTSKTARAVSESFGAKDVITVSRQGDVNYENVAVLHEDASFIINTTPCGMYPDNDSYPLDPAVFGGLEGIIDAVYNPLKTTLVQKGEESGVKGVTGLYMLVAQAVLAWEKFMGEKADTKKVADEIYKGMIKEKQNIVLVGMPGSGKTTVGSLLSGKLGRDFIDTDHMISEKHGVISDIFKAHGEEYFRDIETLAVKEAAKKNAVIRSTGGGAILRSENVAALRQNGVIFFLNRPLEDIVPTADRPLSSDTEALKKRFEERYDKYKSAGDYEVFVDCAAESVANKILECLE